MRMSRLAQPPVSSDYFQIDRDDLSCGKVVGEWSSFAPLGAPRPRQPSALGLVGASSFWTETDYSALEYVRVLSKPGIT
jgi:hypothetical protein